MPEGHKTHYIAREHHSLLSSQVLRVTSPQGRFRGDARKVSGHELIQVNATGKHLFYRFENDAIVHVHLGRYGKFRQHQSPPPSPMGKVRMRIVGTTHSLDLNGPSTCRVISLDQRDEVIAKLGPDPLVGGKEGDVWKRVNASRQAIGAILLDQSIVAGIGNIFRAEALFEVGMDPRIAGCDLSRQSFRPLWRSIVRMMKVGLKHGRIITVTARETSKPLSKLADNERFRVYGKKECPQCLGPIEAMEIASRKLYWCKNCQSHS
jgi:endonuclease-8